MTMPGRNYSSSVDKCRYGMNGQEKDDEIFQGAMSAEFWEYDSRLGRRWETDPIVKPWESPYVCFYNNPIVFSDPYGLDGEDEGKQDDKGKGGDKGKKGGGANSDGSGAHEGSQGQKDGLKQYPGYKSDGKGGIVWGGSDPKPSEPTPTPSNNDNGDDGGLSNPNSTAGSGSPLPTPTTGGGGSTPSGTGGSNPPVRRGGVLNPTPVVLGNPCNPFSTSISIDWIPYTDKLSDKSKVIFDLVTISLKWKACNTSVKITQETDWPKSKAFAPNKQWFGKSPYMVIRDRTKWIQGIMIDYGKIPRSAFLSPEILFDQKDAKSIINIK